MKTRSLSRWFDLTSPHSAAAFARSVVAPNRPPRRWLAAAALVAALSTPAPAQVPQLINYQGRVAVNGVNFEGNGRFRFALVNAAASTSYWSNDGTSTAGSQPTVAVSLPVTKGLYSVLLGDATLTGMTTAIPATVFTHPDVRLRVWFDDGTPNGPQRLIPDQRLAAVGYAMMAGNVPDGAITNSKLAANAVAASNITAGAVGPSQIALGSVGSTHIANSAVGSAQIASGAVGSAQLNSFIGLWTASGTDVYRGSGKVGIGTSNPQCALHINGSMQMDKGGSELGRLTLNTVSRNDPGRYGIQFTNNTLAPFLGDDTQPTVFSFMTGWSNVRANDATIRVHGKATNSWGTRLELTHDGTNGKINTDVGHLLLSPAGNVGIGTSTPTTALEVTGTATLSGKLALPTTASAEIGTVSLGGSPFLHAFGTYNTFVGANAGNFTMTGNSNSAIGRQALRVNTSGNSNTAIGAMALGYNTTGGGNAALGTSALYRNTTGASNTACGASALTNNETGAHNTASGYLTLARNTSGYDNTANGYEALFYNTTGHDNTACGANSLYNNTVGNNNIAIGNVAGWNWTTGSANIAIYDQGVAGESQTIRIGTQNAQLETYIAGIYGRTATGGVAVYVNSSGKLGTVTSSRRFKDAIEDMGDQSKVLLALRPVSFHYKTEIDPQATPQFGLIAEEVNEVAPSLVLRDDKGEIQTVRYEQVNAMLLNEFLKQHQQIADLRQRLAELEKRLAPAATQP